MDSGYRQVDHTADLAIELWAPTEPALLETAALAVTEIMTEGANVLATATREIAIDAIDAEDRLVQWVNEIIYAAITDGFVTAAADIELGTTSLRATVRGEAGAHARVRGELKSATYHDLAITRRDGGWRAFVVIDV